MALQTLIAGISAAYIILRAYAGSPLLAAPACPPCQVSFSRALSSLSFTQTRSILRNECTQGSLHYRGNLHRCLHACHVSAASSPRAGCIVHSASLYRLLEYVSANTMPQWISATTSYLVPEAWQMMASALWVCGRAKRGRSIIISSCCRGGPYCLL